MIAVASAGVPCTITRERSRSGGCATRGSAARHADGPGGEDEVVLALREDRPAQQAREDRYLRHSSGDHDLHEARTIGDDPDREKQRNRKHDVHQPHDHAVDSAAEVARSRP